MPPEEDQIKIRRRSFLDMLLEGSVVAGAACLLYPLAKYVIPPAESEGREAEVEAGVPEQLPQGKATKFEFHGKPGLLMHTRTGFVAVTAICPHLGCIVDWDEGRQQIICPCHNAAFDSNGNVVSGPSPLPLEQYEVDVQEDKIMVRKKG